VSGGQLARNAIKPAVARRSQERRSVIMLNGDEPNSSIPRSYEMNERPRSQQQLPPRRMPRPPVTQLQRSGVSSWDEIPRRNEINEGPRSQQRLPPRRTPPIAQSQRSVVSRWDDDDEIEEVSGRSDTYIEMVQVPQLPGVQVRRFGVGKAVRSYSKVYVPLIFCAIGEVPLVATGSMQLVRQQTVATTDQIQHAITWWSDRFSCWNTWIKAIRALIEAETPLSFIREYILPTKGIVPLIFGKGGSSGFLPHPHARNQERILAAAGIDGEIACCIAFMTT